MIGIIGYGRFSALMARYLSADFEIRIATRKNRKDEIAETGAVQDSLEAVCRLDYVILSVPISALKDVLVRIAPLIHSGATVVDVCSVKEYPVRLMREFLPESVSILATHPMFGPDSAAETLKDKKIVLCKERIPDPQYQAVKTYLFSKGLEIIEATPAEHDRQTARSLALTHFIGRSLSEIKSGPLEIDTEGYKRLLHILGVVENDTWQLFCDMHTYNRYAGPARREFMTAVEKMNRDLEQAEATGLENFPGNPENA